MIYHQHMAPQAWLPIILSATGVITALLAFAWQIHRARFNQSVDLLFRLENDFFGPAKRAQRTKAARNLLRGESLEAEPILDFFETVGLLLRRGALDTEMVAHTFSYWIENYHAALKSHISVRQERDPLVWQDLNDLARIVHAWREKHLGRSLPEIDPDDTVRFLEEELTEASL